MNVTLYDTKYRTKNCVFLAYDQFLSNEWKMSWNVSFYTYRNNEQEKKLNYELSIEQSN